MKNKAVKGSGGEISRRTLLTTGSAAMILAGFGPVTTQIARADALPSAIMDGSEEKHVAITLAFWLAVTNNNSALKLPLDPNAIEKATGLKSAHSGDEIDTVIKRVNSNQKTYEDIRAEFAKITKLLFNYGPGQCPMNLTTLKKLADLDPNA